MNITKELLEQEYPAKNYLKWIQETIKTARKEFGKESITLRKGLCKELMEESLPIAYFVSNYYKENPEQVFISLKIGSQHYDAVVTDKRKNKNIIEYLEVTSTQEVGSKKEGDDYLQKFHLNKYGRTGSGKITRTGSEKQKNLSVKLEEQWFSKENILEHEKETIIQAIERKLKSSNHYPANTALLISFNDEFLCYKEETTENIEVIFETYKTKLNNHNFCYIAVIGKSFIVGKNIKKSNKSCKLTHLSLASFL